MSPNVHVLAPLAGARPAFTAAPGADHAVIQLDTDRLTEMRLLVAFALSYRRGHVLEDGASGDLAVLAGVERRIAYLASAIVG